MLHDTGVASDGAGSSFDPQVPAATDAAAGDFVIVPDAQLLFTGEFKRSGSFDLKIVGEDGTSFVVKDYFRSDKHPTLQSPEGALLTPDIVEALAGPLAPGQYAQAAQQPSDQPTIGRVEQVTGDASVVRNGVTVSLSVGDLVRKGDVVQTAGGSSLAILFSDGTAFNLSANARMVLSEFVYSAGGSGNNALFSLVQGTIGFVASQVAKTGDMKVNTPVTTMGIRGTTVVCTIEANAGTTRCTLAEDPDLSVGRVEFFQLNTTNLLSTLTQTGLLQVIQPGGVTQLLQLQPGDVQGFLTFIRALHDTFIKGQQQPFVPDQKTDTQNTNGQGTQFIPSPTNGGSGDPVKVVFVINPPGGNNGPTGNGGTGPNLPGDEPQGQLPEQQQVTVNIITGTPGDDDDEDNPALFGTDAPDIVFGLGGDDLIVGDQDGGSDIYDGGEGNDTIAFPGIGQPSGNYVWINLSDDAVSVTKPDDQTVVLAANTATGPGIGTDTLVDIENATGSVGDDIIVGDAGVNVLRGLGGNDILVSRGGPDEIYGGEGNDIIIVSDRSNWLISGGSGIDTLRLEGGVDFPHVDDDEDEGPDTPQSIEIVDLNQDSANFVHFDPFSFYEFNEDHVVRILGGASDELDITDQYWPGEFFPDQEFNPNNFQGTFHGQWVQLEDHVAYTGDNLTDGVTFDVWGFFIGDGPALVTVYIDERIGNPNIDLNDPPETLSPPVPWTGPEDGVLTPILTGFDVDSAIDHFRITTFPLNGKLYRDQAMTDEITADDADVDAFPSLSPNDQPEFSATVYFKPDPNYNGPASFEYAAVDELGAQDPTPGTILLSVGDVNDAPDTLSPAAFTGPEDTTVALTLGGSDIDGSIDFFRVTSWPANGKLYRNANGTDEITPANATVDAAGNAATVYFKPNADWNGSTSFNYASVDDDGAQDATPGTIQITVTPVDDAPVAQPDTYGVNEDNTLNVSAANGVLANDSGPQKTAALNSGPAHGKLIFNADGSFTYIPEQNYNGADSFTYHALNPEGSSEVVTVSLSVAAINDKPVIFAPSQLDYWTSSGLGTITAINQISFADADADGEPVTVTLSIGNGGGALIAPDISGDGVGVSINAQLSDVTLTGSIDAINAYIAGNNIRYDAPGTSLADRNLQVTIDDGGNNGAGGTQSASMNINLNSVSFQFGGGNDSVDLHDVVLDGISFLSMGGGGNTLVTSWNHIDTSGMLYDGFFTGGDDTVTLVFSPAQLAEILSNTSFRNEMESYLDGNPGTGLFADTLDLANSSWNATVTGFENATVALASGSDYVTYNAIGDNLPDFMSGQNGDGNNNTLVATGANQTLNGNNGNDILVAHSSGSTLNGGSGADLLLGGAGIDKLTGGSGNDIMAGNGGGDTFVFAAGFGDDVVTDFALGIDRIEIDLDVSNPTSPFSELAQLFQQVGNDTVIHVGSDSITLKNVDAGTLKASDFIIHPH